MRLALAIVPLAVVLAACGGDDGAPLKSADDVRATTTAKSVQALGKAAAIGDLNVVVQGVEYKSIADMANRKPSEEGAAWALVTVRVENRAKKDAGLDFAISCADGTKSYRYFYDAPGSFDSQKTLPPGTYSEGAMLFSMPPSCAGAGVITAKGAQVYSLAAPQHRRVGSCHEPQACPSSLTAARSTLCEVATPL